jgi:hypothetical protein
MNKNMNVKSMDTPVFGKIALFEIFDPNINKSDKKYRPHNWVDANDYLKALKSVNLPCEYVTLPNQQTKPYFDIDEKMDKTTCYDEHTQRIQICKHKEEKTKDIFADNTYECPIKEDKKSYKDIYIDIDAALDEEECD